MLTKSNENLMKRPHNKRRKKIFNRRMKLIQADGELSLKNLEEYQVLKERGCRQPPSRRRTFKTMM